MKYKLFIEKTAKNSLSKIPVKDQDKIIETIQNLSGNPRPVKSKKLSGRDGWRIRIGNYRVIYDIEDKKLVVLVVEIGHRKEIYRK